MKVGKLSKEELIELIFPNIGFTGNNVILKPGLGIDSGVFRTSKNILVVSTDPITASSHLLGKWVVYITTNDVLASGGIPKWFLLTLLLPPDTSKKEIKNIMTDVSNTLKKMKISLVAGHTERTPSIQNPIAIGTAIGEANNIFDPSKVEEGDKIYMFGQAGVEGAYIIYKEKKEVVNHILSKEEEKEIEKFPDLISIYPYANILLKYCYEEIRWMHDPTEGGIYNGLYEMALAINKTLKIELNAVDINPIAMKICRRMNLNPYKLLSSGVLLVIVNRNKEKRFLDICNEKKLEPKLIGIVKEGEGKIEISPNEKLDFSNPEVDEIWKIVG